MIRSECATHNRLERKYAVVTSAQRTSQERSPLTARTNNVEWLARLRSGDNDTWTEWFEDHGPRVWTYVARMTAADSAAVADIVQDVFLAAANRLDSYSPDKGTLIAWLLGIAHNHSAKFWRDSGRRRLLADTWPEARTKSSSDTSGESAALLEELVVAVRSAVASLPAEASAVLIRRYLDDVPVETIASEFGITTEAVRSRLTRARRKLKETFNTSAWSPDY